MQEINTFISLLAVAISFYALIRTRMSENRRRQLEVEVHLQQYYSGVRNWAEQVIQKLTDAAFLCELDPQKMRDTEFFERRRQMRSDLSSLLDKGRLYLPNKNHEEVGLWKSGAYRGLRVAALDLLDRGYKLVESLDYENAQQADAKAACSRKAGIHERDSRCPWYPRDFQ